MNTTPETANEIKIEIPAVFPNDTIKFVSFGNGRDIFNIYIKTELESEKYKNTDKFHFELLLSKNQEPITLEFFTGLNTGIAEWEMDKKIPVSYKLSEENHTDIKQAFSVQKSMRNLVLTKIKN